MGCIAARVPHFKEGIVASEFPSGKRAKASRASPRASVFLWQEAAWACACLPAAAARKCPCAMAWGRGLAGFVFHQQTAQKNPCATCEGRGSYCNHCWGCGWVSQKQALLKAGPAASKEVKSSRPFTVRGAHSNRRGSREGPPRLRKGWVSFPLCCWNFGSKRPFLWKSFPSYHILLLLIVTGALLPQSRICPSKVTAFDRVLLWLKERRPQDNSSNPTPASKPKVSQQRTLSNILSWSPGKRTM